MKARMILQVHDELNFDVPVNEIEQLKRLVTEEMQQAYELRVPLIADSGIADNWLEAH
jgi:DNA polymerase-1